MAIVNNKIRTSYEKISENGRRASGKNLNVNLLKTQRLALEVEFNENDKIITKFAGEDRKGIVYSLYNANITRYHTGSSGVEEKKKGRGYESKTEKYINPITGTSTVITKNAKASNKEQSKTSYREKIASKVKELDKKKKSKVDIADISKNTLNQGLSNQNRAQPSSLGKKEYETKKGPINEKSAIRTTQNKKSESKINALEQKISQQQNKIQEIENDKLKADKRFKAKELERSQAKALAELDNLKRDLKKQKAEINSESANLPSQQEGSKGFSGINTRKSQKISASQYKTNDNSNQFLASTQGLNKASFNSTINTANNSIRSKDATSNKQSQLSSSERSPASIGGESTLGGTFSLTQLKANDSFGDNRIIKLDFNLSKIPASKKEEFLKGIFKEGEKELVLELPDGEKILVSNNDAQVSIGDVGTLKENEISPKRETIKYQDLLDTLKDSTLDSK